MGGRVPLGYDVQDRKLIEVEAATVRRVFAGFIEFSSGTKPAQVLRAEGITTKRGKPINNGYIYKLLNNRTCLGEAGHKGNKYPGEHRGIVSRGTLGPRPGNPAGEPARSGKQEPGAVSGISTRADIRLGRAGHVADPHPAARAALRILCRPVGAEGDRKYLISHRGCQPRKARRR
jgi:hypothetical protein